MTFEGVAGGLGFFMTYGAVGTLDVDPTASIAVQTTIALIGLAMMFWATKGIRNG
jgi:hypothetical protein